MSLEEEAARPTDTTTTATTTTTKCYHGRSGNDAALKITMNIMEDLTILSDATSKQVKKKATVRIKKLQKKLGSNKSTSLKNEMYSICTHLTLEGHTGEARTLLIQSAAFFLEEEEEEEEFLMNQICTDEGLTKFVADKIPCKCLENVARKQQQQETEEEEVAATNDDNASGGDDDDHDDDHHSKRSHSESCGCGCGHYIL